MYDSKSIREFWRGAGYTEEQIAAMEAKAQSEQETMSRPDDSPEKVALIFEQIRKQNEI